MSGSFEWPRLEALRTSSEDLEIRRAFIGGSDANIIFSGDAEKVRDLWLEKRGEKPPVDLSDLLPVMLGCWTEPFNRLWFEQLTGRRISNHGEVRTAAFTSGDGRPWTG